MTDYIAPQGGQQEMELQAFEKGRIQGEMEATRRMEAEAGMQQKQLLPVADVANPQLLQQRPDVIEINRLTWLQRGAALLGEGCALAMIVCTIVWLDMYRGDVAWRDSNDGGNVQFWNTHYLCNTLGLFLLAQAITNYRIGPINMNPWMNRLWYVFLQCCAIICFSLALVSMVRSTPEREVWSVAHWVYCFGYAVFALHAVYSIVVTLLEPMHHRSVNGKYGEWSETGTHLETPEQRRDHSAYNHLARTVYTAAPASIRRGKNLPAANQNVGAQVPVAPANAPRWAENPNTHSEDYWLLPRAKWAVVGFWAIGCGILMDIAGSQQLLAAGTPNWATAPDNGPTTDSPQISETGNESILIGVLGLVTLGTLVFMSYVAMPPRTTLVKNGILVDPAGADRRSSISHNAETKLGNNMV